MTNKKVFIGSDHAGFELKKDILNYLKNKHMIYIDIGPYKYDQDDDYPDYGFKVAEKVGRGLGVGILICKMAGGMTIVANKVKGVRALTCESAEDAIFAKQHNHANILILAALKVKNLIRLHEILDAWFKTEWSNEFRHVRRLGKISKYESLHLKL